MTPGPTNPWGPTGSNPAPSGLVGSVRATQAVGLGYRIPGPSGLRTAPDNPTTPNPESRLPPYTIIMISSLICLAAMQTTPFYDFVMTDIDGKPFAFKNLKGRAVLVVNVASKCGLTPQYEGLEALYRAHKDDGLVVLGFPANDFKGQEPGSEKEIKEFCTATYSVTFPMFSKVTVLGEKKAPLFAWLQKRSDRPDEEIEWNFGKFLINRRGEVVARFTPKTPPTDPAVKEAIKKALADK
ncbi:MAG: hypothetical protein HONBIEJF_01170 [Fimbriimonadaceae bacterium]|nr:hypothetical protein [Fimbriimonadaceae bacterium]